MSSNVGRPAVIVAALDIGEVNALSHMLDATGRYLAQPHIQASPKFAETKRCYDAIVAVISAAGEKLAIQLSLEQLGLENTAGKPVMVLGASDSAQQMLSGLDLSQWLALELEQVSHDQAG